MGKNYIATTNDDLEAVLKRTKTGDNLLLFYYNTHKQIDINLLPVFAKSGIKLELRELPEKNAEMFLAFELGKLSSKGALVSISEDMIVSQFSELISAGSSKPKKVKDNNTKEKKIQSHNKEEAKEDPVSNMEQNKESNFPMPKPIEENNEAKSGNDAAINEDNTVKDEFDEAFDDFFALLSSLKTKDFEPTKSIQKILEVIKNVEINHENMLATCTVVFTNNQRQAFDFIEKNYKVLKGPALKVINLDS